MEKLMLEISKPEAKFKLSMDFHLNPFLHMRNLIWSTVFI